ncbi:MAG TPA: hypothetical protein VFA49_01025, partial [Chloroflexota bacterium]|nr:hypothetical protein [Chloroflexota bacterium]
MRDAADPDAERAAMAELSEAWSQTMRYHARRLGDWRIDSTFDLARVMRVPGTWNCKPGAEPVPARILEYHPARRYEIADFETRLVDPAERATRLGITTNGAVGALPGVDLMAAWRRATSLETRAENYTPEWLAMLLEAMPGSPLEAVWLGDKTLQGDASPSGVDASLTRLLINTRRVNDEQIAEALMCRRLRTGDKPEKVDPTRRTDYLITTISRIRASAATLTPTQAAQQQHWERGAAGRVVTMEPPPGYDAPRHDVAPDEFTDYVLGELDSPANGAEAASNGAAAETVAPVAPTTPAAEAPSTSPSETPRQSAAATPLTLAPPPLPELEQLLWPTRTADAAECFRILGELLLPDPYRAVGIEIWAMEYRDQGEQQKGRMILRIPAGYEWPASNRP